MTARRERGGWPTMLVVCLNSFHTTMALSIIFIIYPDLVASFPDESPALLSWVLTAFTIVGASTLVLGSALGERFGRKRTVLTGSALFTVSSVCAAASPSVLLLVAARAGQAAGASLVLPSSVTIVLAAFPPQRRGAVIALWSASSSAAAALGPSIGGLLVDAAGWRWAFGINLPVGLIVFVSQLLVLADDRPERPGPLPDPVGAVLTLAGVAALVLGLVQSDDWGWASGRTLGSLLVGVLLVGLLVWRCTHHPRPVVDPRLLRHRTFRAGAVASFCFTIGFFGYQFSAILLLTETWGYSIRDAGLLVTPVFALTAVGSVIAARLAARTSDELLLVVGAALWAGSLVTLSLTVSQDPDAWLWVWAAVPAGIGSGIVWGAMPAMLVRDLEAAEISSAMGLQQTLQRLGNALGVATAVTVLGVVAPGVTGEFPLVFLLLAGMSTVGVIAAVAMGSAAGVFRGALAATPPADPAER